MKYLVLQEVLICQVVIKMYQQKIVFFGMWNTVKVQRSFFKMMTLTTFSKKVKLEFNLSHSGSVLSSNTVKLCSVTALFIFGFFHIVVQPIGHIYFIS